MQCIYADLCSAFGLCSSYLHFGAINKEKMVLSHNARREKSENRFWTFLRFDPCWAWLSKRRKYSALEWNCKNSFVRFVQLFPWIAYNGWRTVLTLTTSSCRRDWANEIGFPIRNILIKLTPSFIVNTHTHFLVHLLKAQPKRSSKQWDGPLLSAPSAEGHSCGGGSYAIREKKNVKVVLRPTTFAFPSLPRVKHNTCTNSLAEELNGWQQKKSGAMMLNLVTIRQH